MLYTGGTCEDQLTPSLLGEGVFLYCPTVDLPRTWLPKRQVTAPIGQAMLTCNKLAIKPYPLVLHQEARLFTEPVCEFDPNSNSARERGRGRENCCDHSTVGERPLESKEETQENNKGW